VTGLCLTELSIYWHNRTSLYLTSA